MNFWFHPQAAAEFNLAIDHYEKIEPGLGYDFAREVFSAIERACHFSEAWTPLDTEIRRSLVRRFPYGVLYSVEAKGILMIAVMNLHRDPDYWKDRK